MMQLVFLCILTLIYILFINRSFRDRPSRYILNIMLGYWFVALFLSILRLEGLNEVSDYTYFIMYLGLFSFIAGFSIIKITKKREATFTVEFVGEKIDKITYNKLFLIILFCSCLYVYSTLVIFFDAVVAYQSLYDVRNDYYSGDLYGPVFSQINAFVLTPFSIISTPIFAYMLFFKRNYICFLLGFFLFGYESLSGGRFGYVRIFVAIIFMLFVLIDMNKNYRKKIIKFISQLGVILVLLIGVITALRTNNNDNNGETLTQHVSELGTHLYLYCAGPIVAFDYRLEQNFEDKIGGFKYGQLTGAGFIQMCNLFLSRLGFNFPVALTDMVEYKQNEMISIGENKTCYSGLTQTYNALYTANLYFYYDLGVFGVFFYPFLFGLVLRWLIKMMYKKQSCILVMVVSWLSFALILSVNDLKLVNPYALLTLIILCICGFSKKNCI